MQVKSDRLHLQVGATANAHGEESQGFIPLLWSELPVNSVIAWFGRLCH